MENMEIKRVLVTGSHGYIGTVLTMLLVDKKYSVVGIDTCYYKNAQLTPGKKIKLIKKDIRDIAETDLKNIDAIIHLAALSNDATGELNEKLTEQINFKATIRLAKIAKKNGIKRFIFSSSCSIYGIVKDDIVTENSTAHPKTSYAINKLKVEKELKKLADEKFCVLFMRNATVYGASPCFRDDVVVNNLTMNAWLTGQIRIMSDGTPWRPLIDVRDLSNIFEKFLRIDAKKVNGEIINIGFYENNMRVKDIAQAVKNELPKCDLVFTNEHGADTRSYRVDFNKLEMLFPKLKQQWTVEKSIRDMVKQFKLAQVTKTDLNNSRFTRIKTLKNLLRVNKLSKNLYWKT
jgi:nucleoside-diphosphate-sugar epimerase